MIEFESVSKSYQGGTTAVVDLSLSVPSHQVTVVLGPAGCGQTTLLRMVNRLVEPTRGRITFDGTSIRTQRRTALRRHLGHLNQGGLFPHRTVLDNVATVPGLLGWSTTRTRQRSLELLDLVDVDRKLAHRYPAQLADAQQHRVGLARALAGEPRALLLDQPFAAADPEVRRELHELLARLRRQLGLTIILATHDVDEAVRLGDQVVVLRAGGRLAQVGRPQQLLDDPADAFVAGFVGRDRGYRSLEFLPADGLTLDQVSVVRDLAAAAGGKPTLVVDADARPLGWVDPAQPGRVLALGSTFNPADDTLRVALDGALTSPVGLAVAVEPGTGRYAGVVTAPTILDRAARARASFVPAISVPAADEPTPARQPDPDRGGPAGRNEQAGLDERAGQTAVRVLVDSDAGAGR